MSDGKTPTIRPEWIAKRDGKDFILYAGLLALAHEMGLQGITVTTVQLPSELNGSTAVCSATVQMPGGVFSEAGDASPTNVTRMLAPHIIRMAATRAKARALRDAVNIGVTAFEELGDDSGAAPDSTRMPSVGVRGGEKLDEDAGRFPGTGTAAPRPVGAAAPLEAPDWPGASVNGGGYTAGPTPKQREVLRKFRVPDAEVPATRKEASDLITQKIEEAREREQGRG